MRVQWMKCGKGNWCSFQTMNLASITAEDGVYVIWHAGNPAQVVKVGSGNVAVRLSEHRRNPRITAYAQRGKLLVTWAEVALRSHRHGVERYLADYYQPLVGEAYPDVAPIAVNLPGAA